MIITISGVPGSGKTSVAKIVAERLGLPFYSVGDFRGQMAMDRGMTIDELNALGETDKSTDTLADNYQKRLGKNGDDFVIEGRLSWHFIPRSFKVFLDCALQESARRVFSSHHERPDEAKRDSIEDVRTELDARMASDKRRYAAIYGVDYMDKNHYDLVVDTTSLKSAQETAEKVLAALPPSAS